jgi:hypothetical protein
MSNGSKRFSSLGSIGFSIDHDSHEPTSDEIREALLDRIRRIDNNSSVFSFKDCATITHTLDYAGYPEDHRNES